MMKRKAILAASLALFAVSGAAYVATAQDAAMPEDTVVSEPKIMVAPAGPGAPVAGEDAFHNDYPTNVRADYVFGCMQVNGQTRLELDKCSCSIDVIASVLPYQEYEEAETVLSVRQKGGENVAFLFTPVMSEKVKKLKRAQIEGELRCF